MLDKYAVLCFQYSMTFGHKGLRRVVTVIMCMLYLHLSVSEIVLILVYKNLLVYNVYIYPRYEIYCDYVDS